MRSNIFGRASVLCMMTFEEFAAERLDQLLRTAWAISGDHSVAEDLVQDVLLRAYLRWPSIGSMDHPYAYIRKMLVNEFLSWRRKNQTATVQLVAVQDHLPQAGDLGADHANREAMRLLIAQLPRQQRVVLALRYFEDLSDPDIAVIMGCRPATVRGYASKGLANLREHFNKDVNGALYDRT